MVGLAEEERRELKRIQSLLEVGDYETLFSLGAGVDHKGLRASYYALSRRHHPDRYYRKDLGDDLVIVEQVFAGINLAYQKMTERLAGTKSARPRTAMRPAPEVDQEHGHSVQWDSTQAKKRADQANFKKQQATRKNKKRVRKKPTGPKAPPGVERFKQRMLERLKKAKAHYLEGVRASEAESWSAASSSFYLATQFDPRSAKYKKAFDEANSNARKAQADHLVAAGLNAEAYGSAREAVAHYARAVEMSPPHAEPYYRLGKALRRMDATDRGAIEHLRIAASREPKVLAYRLELAGAYEDNGLPRNAQREFKAALAIKPKDAAAVAGVKRTR